MNGLTYETGSVGPAAWAAAPIGMVTASPVRAARTLRSIWISSPDNDVSDNDVRPGFIHIREYVNALRSRGTRLRPPRRIGFDQQGPLSAQTSHWPL